MSSNEILHIIISYVPFSCLPHFFLTHKIPLHFHFRYNNFSHEFCPFFWSTKTKTTTNPDILRTIIPYIPFHFLPYFFIANDIPLNLHFKYNNIKGEYTQIQQIITIFPNIQASTLSLIFDHNMKHHINDKHQLNSIKPIHLNIFGNFKSFAPFAFKSSHPSINTFKHLLTQYHISTTHISLQNINLPSHSLNYLANFRNLKSITLNDCDWCGATLKILPSLPHLRKFTMLTCCVTISDAIFLMKCTNLTKLIITNTWNHLLPQPFQFKRLTHLKLINYNTSSNYATTKSLMPSISLSFFDECPQLHHIDLSNCDTKLVITPTPLFFPRTLIVSHHQIDDPHNLLPIIKKTHTIINPSKQSA